MSVNISHTTPVNVQRRYADCPGRSQDEVESSIDGNIRKDNVE